MRAAASMLLLMTTACARDPEEALCPEIGPGALVVTEVRGPQMPADPANGEWIELFNTTSAPIDLEGVRVRFRRKDGSSEVPVLVRASVNVAPGGYAVLGLFANDATRPAHVDYGFASDFTQDWLAAAAIDVETCGVRIDRATYDALPKQGTFSLSGAKPPEMNDNDDLRNWCTNGAMTGAAYPGTPQQANPPCP